MEFTIVPSNRKNEFSFKNIRLIPTTEFNKKKGAPSYEKGTLLVCRVVKKTP
jgi:hypothetical protein